MPEDSIRPYVGNLLRTELEFADLERRLQEAEATVVELKPIVEKAKADSEK